MPRRMPDDVRATLRAMCLDMRQTAREAAKATGYSQQFVQQLFADFRAAHGVPAKASKLDVPGMRAMRGAGATHEAIAAAFGVSVITVSRHLRGAPARPVAQPGAGPSAPAADAGAKPPPDAAASAQPMPQHIAAILADPRHRVRGVPPTPREAQLLWEQMRARRRRDAA